MIIDSTITTTFHYVLVTSCVTCHLTSHITFLVKHWSMVRVVRTMSQTITIPKGHLSFFSMRSCVPQFLTWLTTHLQRTCNSPMESNWHATKKTRPYINGFLLGCSDCSSKQQSNGKMTSGEPPAPTIGTMVKTSKFIWIAS